MCCEFSASGALLSARALAGVLWASKMGSSPVSDSSDGAAVLRGGATLPVISAASDHGLRLCGKADWCAAERVRTRRKGLVSSASHSVANDSSSSARREMSSFTVVAHGVGSAARRALHICHSHIQCGLCEKKKSCSFLLGDGWRIYPWCCFSLCVRSSVAQLAICHLCLKVAPFNERTPLLALVAALLSSARSIRPSAGSIFGAPSFWDALHRHS